MATRVVILESTGDHFLGVSHWANSVELSFRRDGSVSVFGYSLRPTEAGALRLEQVFSRTGIRDGKELAAVIEEAVEETGMLDNLGDAAADTLAAVQQRAPALARSLHDAWSEFLP